MKRNTLKLAALAVAMFGIPSAILAATAANPEAQVQAIMTKSHQIQNERRVTAQVKAENEKVRAAFLKSIIKNSNSHAKQQLVGAGSHAAQTVTAESKTTVTDNGQVAQLQAQLDKLSQTNVVFQHQASQRIADLSDKSAAMQSKLAQLAQVLSLLNKEVGQLGSQIQAAQVTLKGASDSVSVSASQKLLSKLPVSDQTIQYSLYGVMGLLGIVILLLLFKRSRPCHCADAGCVPGCCDDADCSDDDYDFMDGEESHQSKLDLARAYIAMEDYKAAKKVLNDVLKHGDDAQKAEASELMKRVQ
jgi:FimV-like protein